MSDDDSDGSSSEDLIGTRIVTEQAAEHLPARERVQRARDNPLVDVRGKPRFHGAFTGGFTAGYYNSVGSKEGWAPSEWRSSRDERAGTSRSAGLRPEDFMDEEDLADVHKAKALVVQEEFQRPAQGAIGGRAKGETSSSGGGAPSRLAEVFSVRSAPSGRHRAACSGNLTVLVEGAIADSRRSRVRRRRTRLRRRCSGAAPSPTGGPSGSMGRHNQQLDPAFQHVSCHRHG